MAKKCEQCGAPAVDSQSLFCNLCGGYVQDEPEPALPVCRACGIPATDDQSVFCTRCGLKYEADPEDRYPVCSFCGSVVPDEYAVFCNRCGAKLPPGHEIVSPTTLHGSTVPVISDIPVKGEPTLKKAPGSVIITKKKHPASHPAKARTGAPHYSPADPSQGPTEAPPYPEEGGKYARLPPGEDEIIRDIQPSKKYAHIPLIADELKVKDTPQGGFLSNGAREPSSSHQKKHAPKKGMLGMFRR